jgi:hypothetical protein
MERPCGGGVPGPPEPSVQYLSLEMIGEAQVEDPKVVPLLTLAFRAMKKL